MGLNQADHKRLDRLASEVKGGGGLILPSLFTALLEELVDKRTADTERMMQITKRVCSNKTKKLAETWGGSWESLTNDAMNQLRHAGHVVETDPGCWRLVDDFKIGQMIRVIPRRARLNAAEDVLIRAKDQREVVAAVAADEDEKGAVIRQPRRRTHPPDVVSDLRNAQYRIPILVDKHGRIIDGRHRREIDPNWPKTEVKRADGTSIETDDEALAVIYLLEHWKPREMLDKEGRRQLDRVFDKNTVKRSAVESALRDDAARSNRAIAEQVGVSENTVAKYREELESDPQIADRLHVWRTQRGGKDGGGKTEHAARCWCGEGTADFPEPKKKKPSPPTSPKPDVITPELLADIERTVLDGTYHRDRMAEEHGVGKSTVTRAQGNIERKLDGMWNHQLKLFVPNEERHRETEPEAGPMIDEDDDSLSDRSIGTHICTGTCATCGKEIRGPVV